MSNRPLLLALAAISTLASAALAPTGASAAPFTVNHPAHWGAHSHPYPICSWGCAGWRDREEDEREHRWSGAYGHPIPGGPALVSVGAPVAPASAAAPTGGCLTKRELPNGSALFRDLCTQEEAESPPAGSAPAR